MKYASLRSALRCTKACLLAASTFSLAGFSAAVQAQEPEGVYLRFGTGVSWTHKARFQDINCGSSQPPALFGCGVGNDGRLLGARGDFDNTALYDLGVGVHLGHSWRLEAQFNYLPDTGYQGHANFLNVSGDQPVRSKGNSRSLMAMTFYDFPALGRVQPFVGAGLGVARNRVGPMGYAFPGLSEEAATIVPGGRQQELAWIATLGLAISLSDAMSVDLAYRYADLGSVRTAAGNAEIVRASGSMPLEIAATEAPLRTDSVTVGLRYRF